MSDIADHAGELEERQRADALRAQSAVVYEMPKNNREGKRICLTCDDRLSQNRLKASPRAVRCVECQDLHEKRQRGYRV
jgi:phage/conjugal plasmid C-4 type zinc finger TraR family protein